MGTLSGGSLFGLLGGLMDSTSTDQLSAAIRDTLVFVKEPHRFVITVNTSVDPSREGDKNGGQ